MLGHPGFDDEARAVRIEPDRQPVECHFRDGVANARKIIHIVGDLVVGDQKVAVLCVLQLEPIFESAGVVAEMQRPGRLNAGKDALPLNARLGASGARARLVRMIIHATPA